MDSLGWISVGAALSQLILTFALLSMRGINSLTSRLFALLLFGVLGYLLLPFTWNTSYSWIFGALSTLIPGAFWLFCSSLFDDHYRFPAWQPALVAATVVLPTIHYLLLQDAGPAPELLMKDVPQVMEFIFLGLALYAVSSSWRDDLVKARRSLRFWFCGISGVFIFLLILSREVLFAGEAWLTDAQYLASAIVLTGTNILWLRFLPNVLEPIARPRPRKEELQQDTARESDVETQLEPITHLIREQGIHREYGMTIGRLASESGIPEYRLRQMINSGLGYRNFNDFLNSFRIEEASARLADPKEARIPVLTIALDVGFRSISSFNKAFKDTHQLTPTAFRKARLEG